jgi:tRNA threonylcarbamoyladenosine biosynthesis protein TsaB
LALETSERVGSLATLEGAGQTLSVWRESLPAGERTAQSLLPAIQTELGKRGWEPKQLDWIAVTSGPGSFTGLRLGVTTAKTLAYATGAQLAEVHTLSAVAAGVSLPTQRLWTVLDAQRNELFVACFLPGWQARQEFFPETHVVGVERWLEGLQSGDTVCGPPLAKLLGRLPAGVTAAPRAQWFPCASWVGQLAVDSVRAGAGSAGPGSTGVNAMQLVPRYYRKSAAEEKADLQP